jgi:carbonic anhydrase
MNVSRRVLPALVLFALALPLAAQTPAQAWSWLIEGNNSFRNGPSLTYPNIVTRRQQTAGSQSPWATIVACADSRVPPELIFHKTLGELFVIRVAGNIVDELALGSIEYAASGPPFNSWSKLIVVLGHSNCGAVESALLYTDYPGTNLQSVLTRIRESFGGMPVPVPYVSGPPPLDPQLMRRATEANALSVVASIRANSPRMRTAERSGSVEIRAAYYDLVSGQVTAVQPLLPRPQTAEDETP